MDVYVADKASDDEVAKLEDELAATPDVERVEFISKEEALERERDRNPEAYDLLGRNPLPDLFRLYPDDPDQVAAIAARLKSENLAAVDDVRDREDDTDKILKATGFVKALTRSARPGRRWPSASSSRRPSPASSPRSCSRSRARSARR